MAILSNKLGYVPALNGNSLATATTLTPTVTGNIAKATVTGIVAQAGTADFFKFTASLGTVTLTGQVRGAVVFGTRLSTTVWPATNSSAISAHSLLQMVKLQTDEPLAPLLPASKSRQRIALHAC